MHVRTFSENDDDDDEDDDDVDYDNYDGYENSKIHHKKNAKNQQICEKLPKCHTSAKMPKISENVKN